MLKQLIFSMLAGALFSAAFALPVGSRQMYMALMAVIVCMSLR